MLTLERALFRSKPTGSDSSYDDGLSKALTLYYQLDDLVSFTGGDARSMPPDLSMPVPSTLGVAIRQGRDAAIEVRRRFGRGPEPIGDVWDLIEKDGIDVGLFDLPEKVSGLMLARTGMRPFIVIAEREHVDRRSFSLAHEYAHVLFDRGELATITGKGDDGTLIEKRANAFASELLLPSDAVRAHFADTAAAVTGADVVALSRRFSVSRQVVLYQLERLNFIESLDLNRLDADAGADASNVPTDFDHAGARGRFRERYIRLAKKAHGDSEISKAKLVEALSLVMGAEKAEKMAAASSRRKGRR